MKHISFLALSLPVTFLAASGWSGATPTAGDGQVTWSSHVNRILQENCESCHRPGQVAPFSLQTYEKARGWGQMIASVVEERRMPPWNAHESFDGAFANERRLAPKDRERLLAWVENDMPRGNPDEDPPAVQWPTGWGIGEPDAVLTVDRFRGESLMGEEQPVPAEGFAVPLDGVVEYQYFSVKTDYPEDRWLQAMEVRPGAPDVVHHVLILVDDPNATAEERRRQLNFQSSLAGAAPGDLPTVYPEDYAKRLPAGATLIFQVHYTPNGKQRFDRSSFAMVFAEQPPAFEVVGDSIVRFDLRIPPGEDNHEVRGEMRFAEDTGIVSLSPHMHTRGKDARYVAHYPDGVSEDLLLADYDFNWQETYILPDPLFLPAGTRLEFIAHFDNSSANPNNPDPSAWVEWGDQTFEEMFIGFFEAVHPVDG